MLWSCIVSAGTPAKLPVKKGWMMHMKSATLVVHDDLKEQDPVEGVRLQAGIDGKKSLVTTLDEGIRGKVVLDQFFTEDQEVMLSFDARPGVEIHICGCYDNIPLAKPIEMCAKGDRDSDETHSGEEQLPKTICRRRFLSANLYLPGERPRKRVRLEGRTYSENFLEDDESFTLESGYALSHRGRYNKDSDHE
eukprot:TRINITY_DN2847_c0_g1_i3.p1 TRINITY_DN2847_c0_g1~~TRINITY_DN2847_c0_g1_i3.p1  ORF type:complete len:193 (-),score=49.65 TRINITY_DN2847_c0_g1_i3:98-676(-)